MSPFRAFNLMKGGGNTREGGGVARIGGAPGLEFCRVRRAGIQTRLPQAGRFHEHLSRCFAGCHTRDPLSCYERFNNLDFQPWKGVFRAERAVFND